MNYIWPSPLTEIVPRAEHRGWWHSMLLEDRNNIEEEHCWQIAIALYNEFFIVQILIVIKPFCNNYHCFVVCDYLLLFYIFFLRLPCKTIKIGSQNSWFTIYSRAQSRYFRKLIFLDLFNSFLVLLQLPWQRK